MGPNRERPVHVAELCYNANVKNLSFTVQVEVTRNRVKICEDLCLACCTNEVQNLVCQLRFSTFLKNSKVFKVSCSVRLCSMCGWGGYRTCQGDQSSWWSDTVALSSTGHTDALFWSLWQRCANEDLWRKSPWLGLWLDSELHLVNVTEPLHPFS